ncbi:hypothetical protein OROGR_018260 [Orobanche gracilis]
MIRRDESNSASKQETRTAATTATATTTTTTWCRSKDPRIVRVSRAFGGKDRHSKVCTVRGLRDRRVRLSVPTAIQLYDLQDRLGLSQPSKVVDWLLNAAKHDIDELPPLQFPQGSFMSPSFQPMMMGFQDFASSQSDKQGFKSTKNHVSNDAVGMDHDETRFNLQNQGGSNDFFDRENNFSSIPNYNSYVRSSSSLSSSSWDHDPSNLTLNHHNQPSVSLGLTAPQNHDLHNFSYLQSSPSGLVSNHVLVYHKPGMIMNPSTQPYFPQTNTEFDPKYSIFQTSSGISNTVRPFQFSMTANLLPWQNNAIPDEDKHA